MSEFDFAFGEVLEELDFDGDDFYTYFLGEFMAGVEYAEREQPRSRSEVELEMELRYSLAPPPDIVMLEEPVRKLLLRGSNSIFAYGVYWAVKMINID